MAGRGSSTERRYAAITEGDRLTFAQVSGDMMQPLDGSPWLGGKPAGLPRHYAEVKLACPVQPRKILGVGKNYADHAKEMAGVVPAEPLFFFKPSSSLLAPEGCVVLPKVSNRVDHEVELGVVIGARARNVSIARAMDHVFGYTVVCDVTARDLQKSEPQWTRAKGFDTFCPAGPEIVTGIDPSDLRLELKVNGELRQSGRTSDMVFGVPQIIAAASAFLTLEPGDVIATGTPSGVGPLGAGDSVESTVEGVGTLRFQVRGEAV